MTRRHWRRADCQEVDSPRLADTATVQRPTRLRIVDPYQAAFHWVRRRLLDEPAASLTTDQLHRASGVAARTCRQVLADLVRSGFLVPAGGDAYARPRPAVPAGSTVGARQGRV